MAEVIKPKKPSEMSKKYQEKFVEDVAGQGALMNDLAKQLIVIQLAIPGIYLSVFKLTAEKSSSVEATDLYITLALWGFSLLFSLLAIFPRKYKVEESVIEKKDNSFGEFGIKDYFFHSAKYKRNLLAMSIVFFFIGMILGFIEIIGEENV